MNSKQSILFVIIFFIGLNCFSATIQDNVDILIKNKDYLGARIYINKIAKKGISYKDWRYIRKVISANPNVGYDLVFSWDRNPIAAKANLNASDVFLQKTIVSAEELFKQKKFQEAFIQYQTASKTMMKMYKNNVPQEHRPLYYNLLQQMARCLYSMEDFEAAINVYSWIPINYYHFRQVVFEKMWTGFRLKRMDIALGSIISQQSSYFSPYIEPESYLLKYYIFKQFCKDKEAVAIIEEMKTFIKLINENSYKIKDWAKQDFYTFSMFKLSDPNESNFGSPQTQLISNAERKFERERIRSYLESQFSKEKIRLLDQLNKVVGYSLLIKKSASKDLQEIRKLPDSKVLSEKGYEYWTYKDQEEWTDEVGSHFYIGESQCKN